MVRHYEINQTPNAVGRVTKRWYTFQGTDRMSLRVDASELNPPVAANSNATPQIDAREHMQAFAMGDGNDLGKQVAVAQRRALAMPRDLRLIESDNAAAADAESGRVKFFRLAHQRFRVNPRLVTFAQIDQQHAVGPHPPLTAAVRQC